MSFSINEPNENSVGATSWIGQRPSNVAPLDAPKALSNGGGDIL